MAKQAAVTYFYQSSFTVAVEKTLLIFSYRQTDLPALPQAYRLSERDMQGFNNIVVFVPLDSLDHHDQAIYTWKQSFPITYVVTQEAAARAGEQANVRAVREGDVLSVANVQIAVHGSTDAGVSFMVKTGGIRIFHAGDLNLWHWREDSPLREIARAEEAFYQAVAAIPREKLDICMFPLDPHLGGFYDAGANHLIMALKPSVFFPMHFGARAEIAADYARRMRTPYTAVCALTQPRETALIDFEAQPPLVRTAASERRISQRGTASRQQPVIDLNAYIEDDPFSETDLPVDLPGGQRKKERG